MFVEEKNPTIVNFPLRGLDFRDCKFMSAVVLSVIKVELDLDAPPAHVSTVYDLIANVTHESTAGTTRDKEATVYKVHLRAGSGGGEDEEWFQIQDLIVEKTRKEMIFLGETVLQVGARLHAPDDATALTSFPCQIWERRTVTPIKMDVDK